MKSTILLTNEFKKDMKKSNFLHKTISAPISPRARDCSTLTNKFDPLVVIGSDKPTKKIVPLSKIGK